MEKKYNTIGSNPQSHFPFIIGAEKKNLIALFSKDKEQDQVMVEVYAAENISSNKGIQESQVHSTKADVYTKIDTVELDTVDIDYQRIEQIEKFFRLELNEKNKKHERQICIDLKKEDARISTYVEILSDFGISIDAEQIELLRTGFSSDLLFEEALQEKIVGIIKAYKKKKCIAIDNVIEVLNAKGGSNQK